MDLSSEIFVLILFIIALPVLILLYRSTPMPGAKYFLAAYICLIFSNTFTVIETWYLYNIFNMLEHIFITVSSGFFFVFIWRLTNRSPKRESGRGK